MPPGYHIFGDSAFPVTGYFERRIVVPIKNANHPVQRSRNAVISAIRMLCEWGNGTIQDKFKRLKVRLSNIPECRKRLLLIAVYMNNLIARRVGIPNQIRTVYARGNADDQQSVAMARGRDRWGSLPVSERTLNPKLDLEEKEAEAKQFRRQQRAMERQQQRDAVDMRREVRLSAAAAAAEGVPSPVRRSPRRRIRDVSDSDDDGDDSDY